MLRRAARKTDPILHSNIPAGEALGAQAGLAVEKLGVDLVRAVVKLAVEAQRAGAFDAAQKVTSWAVSHGIVKQSDVDGLSAAEVQLFVQTMTLVAMLPKLPGLGAQVGALLGRLQAFGGAGAAGDVATGSGNIEINGLPAARASVDVVHCLRHPPDKKIAQGSATVDFNSHPAARAGDMCLCGAPIKDGSHNVEIGGGRADVEGPITNPEPESIAFDELPPELQARLRALYGDSIDYSQVRIQVGLPGFLDPNRPITLGNDIFVPQSMFDGLWTGDPYATETIAHELFHVAQGQWTGLPDGAGGIKVIVDSLYNQATQGLGAYDYTQSAGQPFSSWNVEQQAELVGSAFYAGYFDPATPAGTTVWAKPGSPPALVTVPPGGTPPAGYTVDMTKSVDQAKAAIDDH